MRVALVAETFTPAVNGVVNSVLRTAGELAARGHEPVVIAPSGAAFRTRTGRIVPVIQVPSVALPGYGGLRVARPGLDLRPILREIGPDLVHLASPAILGWAATRSAGGGWPTDVPTVAVFQTDLSGFLRRYGLGATSPLLWTSLRHLHERAALTLAPSTVTASQLRRRGITSVAVWPRGVDSRLFHPRRRDEGLRRQLLGERQLLDGRLLVGAVGRLASEKRLHLLEPLSRAPGVQLVIVGDGPRRAALERRLPHAVFLGQQTGTELARTVSSLDVLVHAGADETFCQVVQEALCSGVPVVAAASGGPLDLVRHGENGWLWAGEDPHELAALVTGADLHGPRRRARGSVAFRTWSSVTDQLLVHYDSVLPAASLPIAAG